MIPPNVKLGWLNWQTFMISYLPIRTFQNATIFLATVLRTICPTISIELWIIVNNLDSFVFILKCHSNIKTLFCMITTKRKPQNMYVQNIVNWTFQSFSITFCMKLMAIRNLITHIRDDKRSMTLTPSSWYLLPKKYLFT